MGVGDRGTGRWGGKLYGAPCGTDSLTCLYYNTKVLDRAGVEVDIDKVQEWDEFIGMLDKIKSTGVTPLALNSTSYIYFTLLYWIAQQVGGSSGIVDLGTGKRKFASPEVQTAVDRWLSLKSYANAGVPVTEDEANMKQMLQSKAAVMSGADLAGLRTGLGQSITMTKLPNISTDAPLRDSGIGGPGQAFVIPAASKNIDATVEFINFLSTSEQQLKRAKLNEGPLPNVPDLTATKVFTDPLRQKLATWSTGTFVFWPDNTLDANLVTELGAKAQLAWNGNLTSTQFLEQLDKKRDQILRGA
ncbi:MAG TPA: extracellular solute-binding protein [Actinopolymorphaceae bacterium]